MTDKLSYVSMLKSAWNGLKLVGNSKPDVDTPSRRCCRCNVRLAPSPQSQPKRVQYSTSKMSGGTPAVVGNIENIKKRVCKYSIEMVFCFKMFHFLLKSMNAADEPRR